MNNCSADYEIERQNLFKQLPSDEFLNPKYRKRLNPGYNYCAWCGERKGLYNFKITCCDYGHITLFCRRGECFQNYGQCLGLHSADLTNGIPYIWKHVKITDQYYCKVPKRERDSKGQLIDLTCMYCGKQNGDVISHPLVPKKYSVTSFCRNRTCYSSFTEYVDKIMPARTPYAFSIDCDGNLINSYAENSSVLKTNNTKQKYHSHSLTLCLPIVLNRDEYVHKDVGIWCPNSDVSIDFFRNVLNEALWDFAQDCNAEELLKKVKCVKKRVSFAVQ
jgi:hypothetical protein